MMLTSGKFKGRRVEDLSDAYLLALLASAVPEPLRTAVVAEAIARGLPVTPRPLRPVRAVAEELIGVGLRVLARRHHPDAGGDVLAMQNVTAAAAWLRGRLRELAS
jgi:hypothetical protein